MVKVIKKVIALLLVATAVLLLMIPAADVNATYSKGDYVIDGGTLVSYTGTETDITIPIGITEIGKDAFSGNNTLTKVYIPDEVTKIDYAAFENCKNLHKVDLGDGVKSIGASAFSGCSNLSDANIPKYVEDIGSGAFAACPKLSDLAIDENNRSYICLDGVLYTRDGRKMVQYLAGRPYSTYIIPEPVKEIEEFGFYGANMLTDVTIAHGVEEIPEYAFLNCTALNNVGIPNTVKAIRKGAFGGCPNLTKLTVPTSVGYIDEEAFTSMDGKKGDVINETNGEVLSESGETIGTSNNENRGFDYSDANNEEPPQETLDNNAPADNLENTPVFSNITEGEMASTTIVGGNAVFLLDPKSMKVRGFDINAAQTEDSIADSGNSSSEGEDFRSYSGRTFDVIKNVLGHYGGNDSNITLPDDIKKLGNRVFYNNKNIQTVNLPNGLSEIGDFAFARSSVEQLDIPDGTEKIGYAAFYNCNNLTKLSVPSSIKDIELGAFEGSGFLNNWKSIEDGNNFLVLGDGILVAYKGHSSEVVIPHSVKSIGPGVFEGNTRIKNIVIPETVTKICEDAFNGCKNINQVTLPESLITVEDRAFKDTSLTSVNIPRSVKEIGLGAFDTVKNNGGINAVVFSGVNVPNTIYKPTASRLSASELRTPAFNGVKNVFVLDSCDLDSGTIFDPYTLGYRGPVYSNGGETSNGEKLLKLRRLTKEPETDGGLVIDSEIKIGEDRYYLAGITDRALDYYRNPDWCENSLTGIKINGDSSDALNDLISDISFSATSESNTNSFSDSEAIRINVIDNCFDKSEVNAILPNNTEKFVINIKKDDSLVNSFNEGFENRYGDFGKLKMFAFSMNMTDRLGSTDIKKMSTNKVDFTLPVPPEFNDEESIRIATLDDNGLLEELACDVTDTSETTKNISFVASHLSPFVIFCIEYGETMGNSSPLDNDMSETGDSFELQYSIPNKIKDTIQSPEATIETHISAPQAFASNTVNSIAGEAVYGTLQKEITKGVPVRYVVILILFATAAVLLFNKRKIK